MNTPPTTHAKFKEHWWWADRAADMRADEALAAWRYEAVRRCATLLKLPPFPQCCGEFQEIILSALCSDAAGQGPPRPAAIPLPEAFAVAWEAAKNPPEGYSGLWARRVDLRAENSVLARNFLDWVNRERVRAGLAPSNESIRKASAGGRKPGVHWDRIEFWDRCDLGREALPESKMRLVRFAKAEAKQWRPAVEAVLVSAHPTNPRWRMEGTRIVRVS